MKIAVAGLGYVGLANAAILAQNQRVSDLLCMSNLSHASILKEHDNNDDFQGRSRRTA